MSHYTNMYIYFSALYMYMSVCVCVQYMLCEREQMRSVARDFENFASHLILSLSAQTICKHEFHEDMSTMFPRLSPSLSLLPPSFAYEPIFLSSMNYYWQCGFRTTNIIHFIDTHTRTPRTRTYVIIIIYNNDIKYSVGVAKEEKWHRAKYLTAKSLTHL